MRPIWANAIFDAHTDDPEFGYRFLFDENIDAGHEVSERTVWRICSDNGWWSVFGKKKRGKKTKVGQPAHDDLVRRDFTAAGPNQLWLTDLTEHRTTTPSHAVLSKVERWLGVGCIRTGDRNFAPGSFSSNSGATRCSDRWAKSAQQATTRPWRASSLCSRRTCSIDTVGRPATSSASRSCPWIERTYHRRRRQDRLGRLTPNEFELIMSKAADQAA